MVRRRGESSYATKNRRENGEGLAGVAPEFTDYLDGIRLTPLEIRTQLAFLLMSGNETTRPLIANLLETVCLDPVLFARFKADPELLTTGVEESLRHDPPIHVLIRDCIGTVAVNDTPIPVGAKVAFGLAAANRDPAMYDAPDEFRLDRARPKDHLGFGGGPHVCPTARRLAENLHISPSKPSRTAR